MTVSRHGTRSRYVQGCRCLQCTAANKLYRREVRSQERAGFLERYDHGTSELIVKSFASDSRPCESVESRSVPDLVDASGRPVWFTSRCTSLQLTRPVGPIGAVEAAIIKESENLSGCGSALA